MKTFTTIASALVLMSTVSAVSAGTKNDPDNQWTGSEDISTLPYMCKFVSNIAGHMDLSTTTKTWTTTAPSMVTVEYRGHMNITVEADNSKWYQKNFSYDNDGALVDNAATGNGVIHGHEPGKTHGEVFDAVVDYANSKYKNTQDGGTLAANWTTVASGGSFTFSTSGSEFAGIAEIKINGTAKPTGVAIYTADAEYHVPHKITCVQ